MSEVNTVHPSFAGVLRQKERIKEKLSGIKNKIGVYSAKGGVGKTTVSVNFAVALASIGYSVGLLDADIDCPNVPLFMGIKERMDISQFPLKPLTKNNVKVASTAMIVDDTKKPIIWRGALIAKMLGDFFENTEWGALDYLIIDLPPGTSDSPLSIMQLLDMTGFVMVTTPAKIASINSIRSGLMVKRLGKPILGIIENMSDSALSKNTIEVANELGAEVLGHIPFDRRIADLEDEGRIPVLESDALRETFVEIIKKIKV
ncbi:Mrp/NBP35 family ATP-binding protein [Candidatus Marsarchaeota archaeon]|nr:Mrp/NBP35 family ATP-binding protein [Candidatus Marsarchaeota archaeon]MCL5404894.1 Mrp/NBP35 family ATP-binding protein [Candidatus Marsarchaeota archaeon]